MGARGRIYGYGSATLVVAAGAACAFVVPGITGSALAITLITIGLGAVVLLVFYEVGMSEERELAEQERRREARRRSEGPLRPRPPRRRRR